MTRKYLVIYNLETDSNSVVLATGVEWIRELSLHFEKVMVFSTHTGIYNLPNNVVVTELGGGTYAKKIRSLYQLYKSTLLVRKSGEWAVFHHMSSKTLAVLGPIYRARRVRQVLWYSHNHDPIHLRAAYNFANSIVCPTSNSFPIKTKKVTAIGHAIPYSEMELTSNTIRNGVVHVGRLVKVKHIEDLIDEVKKIPRNLTPRITLIGPVPDETYKHQLVARMRNNSLDFEVLPAINYLELRASLGKFKFCFSGTPKSVDKAALEAAMSGCFVVSNSCETLELTGMLDIWEHLKIKPENSLANQMITLSKISSDEEESLRRMLINSARKRNGIEKTIERLVALLKD